MLTPKKRPDGEHLCAPPLLFSKSISFAGSPVRYLVILLFLIGCDDDPDPDVSKIPKIVFEDVAFLSAAGTPATDTIALTLTITDGDFDLGLSPVEYDSPFHYVNFVLDHNGSRTFIPSTVSEGLLWAKTGKSGVFVDYALEKSLTPDPVFVTCETFLRDHFIIHPSNVRDPENIEEQISADKVLVLDTLMIQHNPGFHNIKMDFLIEGNNGEFYVFDWNRHGCNSFNGRFPDSRAASVGQSFNSGPFTVRRISKTKAELRYDMASVGFRTLFGGKQMKLRFSVKDRALNESNVVETPVFTIE